MTNQYLSPIATPIGDTVVDLLVDHGMRLDDLALQTGFTNEMMVPYLYGKVPLTKEFADKLAKVFSPPSEFWLKLDQNYHETIKRLSDQ